MIGFQGEVGHFLVQRGAQRGHAVQHLFAVRALQQRAIAVARQPGQLGRHAHMQVHHEAALADALAIARIQDRAAAGGDQFVALREQAVQGLGFVLAKARFAVLFEDRGDAAADLLDDGLVHIHEIQPEALGQAAADAAFTGAHRADHHEIGSGVHAPGS